MQVKDAKRLLTQVGATRCGAALALAAALSAGGCVVVGPHDDGVVYDYPPVEEYPVFETIDTDQALETNLGEGAGVFAEYYAGGTWVLWTSCDTYLTDSACDIEIHVITDSVLGNVTTSDFEAEDNVDVTASDELWVDVVTTTDSDAVQFDAAAGASAQIEVWVDGYLEPDLIYWIGNGAVHEGAVGSPVVFEPSSP